jgi:hypothetical protein
VLQSANSSHHRREYSLGGQLEGQEDAVLVALKEGMRSVVAGPAARQLSVVQVADVDLDDDEQVGGRLHCCCRAWRALPPAAVGGATLLAPPAARRRRSCCCSAARGLAEPCTARARAPQVTCCGRLYTRVFENRGAQALFRLRDRVLRTTLAAMVYDVLDVLIYIIDMYTDIKVGSSSGGVRGA